MSVLGIENILLDYGYYYGWLMFICFEREDNQSESVDATHVFNIVVEHPKQGVDEGPLRIIEAGLLDDIKRLGWDVEFEEHHRFEPMHNEDDPPIGMLKRPRLV